MSRGSSWWAPRPASPRPLAYLGFPYFSVSRNAVLLYRPTAIEDLQLTWFDRQGKPTGPAGPPGLYNHVSVAPDGSRVIVSRKDAQTPVKWDLWLWDSKRGANTRLTFDAGRPDHPVLSPDESLIAYSSREGAGPATITIRRFDGSSQEEITGGPGSAWHPTCWSHDGRFLLFTSTSASGSDIWLLPRSPAAQPVRIIGSPFNKDGAQFSPDLRWIAYTSDESGRIEIYVRPFSREAPAELPPGQWPISTNGGTEPRWRVDGRELIYAAPDRKLMAVEIKPGDRFEAGIPQVLFQLPPGASFGDMSADARRFLFGITSAEQPPFNVVLNWPATLERR